MSDHRGMPSATGNRRVVILLYPGVQSLDVTGPLEVFAGAQRLIDATGRAERSYEVRTVSRDGGLLRTSSGLTITPDGRLCDTLLELDTLIVPGGEGRRDAENDRELLEWLAGACAETRRTASVCTGAFLLARAGLLDGRRATTHWAAAHELQSRYPNVDVDADPIHVRDGNIWTSAGVTAEVVPFVVEVGGGDRGVMVTR